MDKQQLHNELKDDLIAFGRVISPKTYYLPTPEFHYEVCDLLSDTSIIQGLIEAPRGTSKSTLCINEVLRHCIYDEGDKLVIIQSKTRPEAIRRLQKIKDIIEYSPAFRDIYGYFGEQISDVWREHEIQVRTPYGRWVIVAIGTGQPARGYLSDDTRITLYYLDDPDDEDNTITKEQMDKNFDKFLGNRAGLDMRNGRIRVVGTPIREGCIVERLRNALNWTTLHYQVYYPDDNNRLLWEEMYSLEWILNKKEEFESVGKRSKFFSEYQCQIMGDEDRLFKDWKYWNGELEGQFLKITHRNKIELPEPEYVPVNIFLGIDPASSTKKTADYSVTFAVAYDIDKNIYCLPYFRKRTTPHGHAEQIIQTIKNLKPTRGHVETVAYQEMMRQYLRMRLQEEDIYLPGLEIKFNPRTEKSARLDSLHPYFAQGKVYLKEGMPELEDELQMYPRGRHDDLLDGMYYATRKLIRPHHTVQDKNEDDLRYFITYSKKKNGWLQA